ncbi:MAG: uroporphyrinogen-III synthase [Alphaproteobacteria bacterium]
MSVPKKIVVTRANHQAQAFAAALVNRANGISMNDFVFEPMTEIIHFPFNTAKFEDYSGIIMTRMNAAVSLGLNAPARDLLVDRPFFCVGEHTKQKILDVGAQEVAICAPTAKKLVEEMFASRNGTLCARKKFLYLRGRDIAFDMKEALVSSPRGETQCVSVDEIVCYEAKAVKRFSPNISEALLLGEVGLITFFSKRTAEVFLGLWEEESEKDEAYEEQIKNVKVLCMSKDVAESVQDIFGRKNCFYADKPSMDGMIDKVKDVLS